MYWTDVHVHVHVHVYTSTVYYSVYNLPVILYTTYVSLEAAVLCCVHVNAVSQLFCISKHRIT